MNFAIWFKSLFKNPVFFLLLSFLYFLPFFNGGTGDFTHTLIYLFPFPLLLIGLKSKTLQFENVNWKSVLIVLALLIVLTISTFFSANKLYSVPTLFLYFAYFIYFFLFILSFRPDNLKSIFYFLTVTSLGLIFSSFFTTVFGWGSSLSGMNLIYANYGHSHLADYLLLVLPFWVSHFFLVSRKKHLFAWGGVLAFYLAAFFLTFSRGAYLVFSLVILILFWIIRPQSVFQRVFSWVAFILPFFIFINIFFFSTNSALIKQTDFHSQHWLSRQLVKPDLFSSRGEYWLQALNGFLAHPWLGYGPGTFELISLRFQKRFAGWSSYAHNFYLQLLAEGGIFAFGIFLIIMVYSFYKVFDQVKANRKNPLIVGGFGALIASSLHSILDYDWHFPAVFLTFLLLWNTLSVRSQTQRAWLVKGLKFFLSCLAILVFSFGIVNVVSFYFEARGDFWCSVFASPWPPTRLRRLGQEICLKNPEQCNKIFKMVFLLAPTDTFLNYWIADNYYQMQMFSEARDHYEKAVIYNPLGNWRIYSRILEIDMRLGRFEASRQLLNNFAQHLEEKNIKTFGNGFGKMIYQIGLTFMSMEPEETVFWWEKSIEVDPEWSYYHIELASLKIQMGKEEEALKILQNCTVFYYPKSHCQEILDRLKREEVLEPAGFYRDEIQAIPE